MSQVHQFILYILDLNIHLGNLVTSTGHWIYVILFFIIFAETGLIIFPFLPGDALLFSAGSLTAITTLNLPLLMLLLFIAAILGNTVNYQVGYFIGPRIFHFPRSRFFNPDHLHKAHQFYVQYGGRALVIARFLPILRTFAPFIAGIAKMPYHRFQFFNIAGSALWIGLLLSLGRFVGNTPFVQKNFSLILLLIIIISLLPALIQYLKDKLKSKKTS
jgi:membrane-associated protein